jgi:hypothetical protein
MNEKGLFNRICTAWPVVVSFAGLMAAVASFFIWYGGWSYRADILNNTVAKSVERLDNQEKRISEVERAVREIPEMRSEIKRILEIVLSIKRNG